MNTIQCGLMDIISYQDTPAFPVQLAFFQMAVFIEWSDLIASSNLMASDVDLNTSLRFGLEGLYLWAWPAQSAENDWATSHVLDDGIVFKYDPLKTIRVWKK